jgi:hypothetical protein
VTKDNVGKICPEFLNNLKEIDLKHINSILNAIKDGGITDSVRKKIFYLLRKLKVSLVNVGLDCASIRHRDFVVDIYSNSKLDLSDEEDGLQFIIDESKEEKNKLYVCSRKEHIEKTMNILGKDEDLFEKFKLMIDILSIPAITAGKDTFNEVTSVMCGWDCGSNRIIIFKSWYEVVTIDFDEDHTEK